MTLESRNQAQECFSGSIVRPLSKLLCSRRACRAKLLALKIHSGHLCTFTHSFLGFPLEKCNFSIDPRKKHVVHFSVSVRQAMFYKKADMHMAVIKC